MTLAPPQMATTVKLFVFTSASQIITVWSHWGLEWLTWKAGIWLFWCIYIFKGLEYLSHLWSFNPGLDSSFWCSTVKKNTSQNVSCQNPDRLLTNALIVPKNTLVPFATLWLPNIFQTANIPTMTTCHSKTHYMKNVITFLCGADKSEERNFPSPLLLPSAANKYLPKIWNLAANFFELITELLVSICLQVRTPTCINSDTHTAAVWSILRSLATRH